MSEFLLYCGFALVLIGLFYCALNLYAGLKICGGAILLLGIASFNLGTSTVLGLSGFGIAMFVFGSFADYNDKRVEANKKLKDLEERSFWNTYYPDTHHKPFVVPDYENWMKHRVSWYTNKKSYPFEKATRTAQEEYDEQEERFYRDVCFFHKAPHAQLSIPDHERWMKYRVDYWHTKKGYSFEKATRKAQQEYDDAIYVRNYSSNDNRNIHREARRPQYIENQTNYYIEKGYSRDDAMSKANTDFLNDYDP